MEEDLKTQLEEYFKERELGEERIENCLLDMLKYIIGYKYKCRIDIQETNTELFLLIMKIKSESGRIILNAQPIDRLHINTFVAYTNYILQILDFNYNSYLSYHVQIIKSDFNINLIIDCIYKWLEYHKEKELDM